MSRLSVFVSGAVIAFVALASIASISAPSAAQDATPSPSALHPVVGTWLLVDTEDPDEPPSLVIFTSDGIYQQTDFDGTTGFGVWEATGPTSAAMTFMQQFSNEEGEFGGSATIRATIEVDPDGTTFTAIYTLEFGGEGAPSGEFGPGDVTATRMNVEPMGEPAGSLEELFAQFEGTPEAEAAGGESVTVTSHDIFFDPTEVTIAANTDVTIVLPNEGAAPHNFTIDELDVSIDQASGETHEITVNAPPGTYEYYCNVPGHREAGMYGVLTVE